MKANTVPRNAILLDLLRAAAAFEVMLGHLRGAHWVDFARLPAVFPTVDDVFIALGTTIKVARSEAAFRQVDFDFVVNTARAARAAGATRLAVVSALGADAESHIFYNRVKGEDAGRYRADWLRIGCDGCSVGSCPRGYVRSPPAPWRPRC